MTRTTDNTAVVVIDCQNDFCHPDGVLYAEASEDAIENVNRVIQVGRDNSLPIIFTQDTHEEGHPEFEQWGEHCLDGSWGHALHDEIDYRNTDFVVQKDTYDAVYKTDLKNELVTRGIEHVVICGTLVNVCVQETASSLALEGYDVSVVEDAVGYLNDEQKQAALDHIDFLIGEKVTVADLW
jgi:nicotinamidase-related amidase